MIYFIQVALIGFIFIELAAIVEWIFGFYHSIDVFSLVTSLSMGILWATLLYVGSLVFQWFQPDTRELLQFGFGLFCVWFLGDIIQWRRGAGYHPRRPIWRKHDE